MKWILLNEKTPQVISSFMHTFKTKKYGLSISTERVHELNGQSQSTVTVRLFMCMYLLLRS
jgi:hypothetical protein